LGYGAIDQVAEEQAHDQPQRPAGQQANYGANHFAPDSHSGAQSISKRRTIRVFSDSINVANTGTMQNIPWEMGPMNADCNATLYESDLHHLELVHRGKVRDVYEIGAHDLLMVACDRLSAFDVVMPDAIPGKGGILNQMSRFWFEKTAHIIPNHLADLSVEAAVGDHPDMGLLKPRSSVVQKLRPVPVEAIVRGYLAGSGWKDYQATGQICGHRLPPNMEQATRLPQPLFTPSTKASVGDHDENISMVALAHDIGDALANKIEQVSIALYRFAAGHARERGIIIADTKFEFGLDESGDLILMDEIFTPDSSRFWPVDQYHLGISPPSYDKQYVRDYLETLEWGKTAPGPALPSDVISRTAEKYQQAWQRLSGPSDSAP
jgi:phosphoribosylaminoimidazole-succinocarboxamide synthase